MQWKIITMLGTVILTVLTSPVGATSSQLNLEDFAYGTELTSAETEFRRFILTTTMIQDIQRRDLGDLRVYDEDNELMPILIRKKDSFIKNRQQKLSFSPQANAGKTTSYILDRASSKLWLNSLQLQWKPSTGLNVWTVRVEHSSDQHKWEILKDSQMVSDFKFGDKKLKQNVIDINNRTQRYIKLTFLDAKRLPVLKSVVAHTSTAQPSNMAWVSVGQLQSKAGMPGSYFFKVSKGVSPNLVSLGFKKLNTLLSGSLYTVTNIDGKLKQKISSNNFNAYKVTMNNKVVNSKPVDLSQWQASEWLITADAVSNLKEDDLPEVMVAYPQYEVIFAADGDEPYTVVWGNRTATPVANDIITRIRASGKKRKDVAMVAPGYVLDSAGLAELVASRSSPWWLYLFALILVVLAGAAVKFGYQRYHL